MSTVFWLSKKDGTPGRGYWDQNLLEELLIDFNHLEVSSINPGYKGGIVIIPGAYQAPYIDEINQELNKLHWCIVIVTSDEENNFPLDELKHPRMKLFANYYNDKTKNVDHWLPIGPARSVVALTDKIHNWAFMGQITHDERREYAKVLRKRDDGFLLETDGFAKGLEPLEYHKVLASTKVVPAPGGPISEDSFRLYEAIEAGAVPIPAKPDFWENVFGQVPFPVIEKYEQLDGYINDAISQYPKLNNEVQIWWLQQKHRIKRDIHKAIEEFGDNPPITYMTTIIVPVSPIKSHPDTVILDETLSSVRFHYPDSKIIVTLDGVREEYKDRENDYEEFKRRFIYEASQDKNILILNFKEHTHQVGMAREAMKYVDTPLILYIEQDTPLVTDMPFDWGKLSNYLLTGDSNMIRFHFESVIPKPHEHMMHGMEEIKQYKLPLMRTSQWSQRPHLATKAFYDRILRDYFSEDAKSFIEDKMHSVLHTAYLDNGTLGWHQFKVHIYCPEGNIKRSYHTDGRAGEEKYDDTQTF